MAEKAERNAGYTLVELLIAVTILAIIAVPLMHAFGSSARTNAKSRKTAKATMAAWNVMEEIKAMPLSDILAASEKQTETMETGVPGEALTYVTYKYDYGTVPMEEYDFVAKVELKPGAYTGDGSWSDAEYQSDEITDYNRTSLPRIYDMNPVTDASWLMPAGEDAEMAEQFDGSRESVLSGMNRTIFLDIRREGRKTLVEVNISYTWNGTTKDAFPQKKCIYRNEADAINLRNVYLFFLPMRDPGADREHIVIRNLDEIPVNVYLIRQGIKPDTSTGYRVEVDILEQGRTADTYTADGKLNVWTHLRTNLFENSGAVDGIYDGMKLRYGTREGDYMWEITPVTGGVQQRYTAAELTDLADLVAEAVWDRVCNVTVTIYEKDEDGNATSLVSVFGTKEK